ncbi:MAG: hypothetical protein IT453_06835 [Planctomycetes bacterium]|nr:hypothetical protein [Planctomycetota bacterium]
MKLSTILLPVLALCSLAGRGEAQVVEIGFKHAFKHGSISIGLRHGDRHDDRRSECRPSYRVWVPGHYETREERVWVAGECRRVWVEPVYGWRTDYRGCRSRVQLRAGYWETIEEPGHYETRRVQVWVEGYWTSP